MKNGSIVVRKRGSHRLGGRLLLSALVFVPFLLSVLFRQLLLVMVLLCAPLMIMVLMILLYVETWYIRFDHQGITHSVFGVHRRVYGWGDITDVITRWSSSDNDQILRISFRDGRSVKFRLSDENGELARKWILSRHTIRVLE